MGAKITATRSLGQLHFVQQRPIIVAVLQFTLLAPGILRWLLNVWKTWKKLFDCETGICVNYDESISTVCILNSVCVNTVNQMISTLTQYLYTSYRYNP